MYIYIYIHMYNICIYIYIYIYLQPMSMYDLALQYDPRSRIEFAMDR